MRTSGKEEVVEIVTRFKFEKVEPPKESNPDGLSTNQSTPGSESDALRP
jgi:hypothetical protein